MNSNQNLSIEKGAMFKLSYGLFVLTARSGDKDNGCITNTAVQLTDSPSRISVAVNKSNLTHDMIKASGEFNVSVLTESAPFSLFERFGFQSGRNADKFFDNEKEIRTANGIVYLQEHTNAVISAKVTDSVDFETHTLFIAEVTSARILSDGKSITYDYYFANTKPKVEAKKKGFVCKICGYVYEGDTLPDDFICPICKHPAEDFEPIV